MVWEFPKNGLPKWHDHPLRNRGRKRKVAIAPLELIGRREWGALPNNDENPLEIPVHNVRTTETGTDPCNSREECDIFMQQLQEKHMREGMPDVQYNFLVGADGIAYEGRGWLFDATRTDEFMEVEEDCIDIAYIGKFKSSGEDIPDVFKQRTRSIIEHGLENNYIYCCFRNIPFDNQNYYYPLPVDA